MTCSSVERRRFAGWYASSIGSLLDQFLYHRLVYPPSVYYSAVKTNEEGSSETIVLINQTTRCHIAHKNLENRSVVFRKKRRLKKSNFFFSWHLKTHLALRTIDCLGCVWLCALWMSAYLAAPYSALASCCNLVVWIKLMSSRKAMFTTGRRKCACNKTQ
jgi:hypothetical protein